MDPLTIGLGLASVGMSIFGQVKQAQGSAQQVAAARQSAAASSDIAQQEMGIDAVKRNSMELSAHRSSLQDIRSAQAARSMALTAGTSQGANFSSVMGGAYGGISGQLNTGLQTISNNLQSGRQIFDYNNLINQDRMKQATAQSDMATGAGTMALGKTIAGVAGTVGNLAGMAGGIGKSLFAGSGTMGIVPGSPGAIATSDMMEM